MGRWSKYKRYARKLLVDPYKKPFQSMRGIYTGLRKGEGFSDVMSRAARPLRTAAGGSLIGAIAPLAGKVIGGYFAGSTGAKVGGAVGSELGQRFEESAGRQLTSERDALRRLAEERIAGLGMDRFQSPMDEAWQRGRRYMRGMGDMRNVALNSMRQLPAGVVPYRDRMAMGGAGMLSSVIGNERLMGGLADAASSGVGYASDLWGRMTTPEPTFDAANYDWSQPDFFDEG